MQWSQRAVGRVRFAWIGCATMRSTRCASCRARAMRRLTCRQRNNGAAVMHVQLQLRRLRRKKRSETLRRPSRVNKQRLTTKQQQQHASRDEPEATGNIDRQHDRQTKQQASNCNNTPQTGRQAQSRDTNETTRARSCSARVRSSPVTVFGVCRCDSWR